MYRYAASEIRFNLLAVTESKHSQASSKIRNLRKEKGQLYNTLSSTHGISLEAYEDAQDCQKLAEDTKAEGGSPEDIKSRLSSIDLEIASYMDVVTEATINKEKYTVDNYLTLEREHQKKTQLHSLHPRTS